MALYKIGEVHFRMFDTNGFHVKAKNERFTAAGSRCRQNLKFENLMSSFGRLRRKIAPKSLPHVQHDYISSFNQSNHWFNLWRCCCCCLRLYLNSLISDNTSVACISAFSHLNGLCRSKVREFNVGAMFIEEYIASYRNQTNIQRNRHWMRV